MNAPLGQFGHNRQAERTDAVDKVTGHGPYLADLTVPGMLEARVLRSPHAHARIRSIDVTKAVAMEGIRCIATGDDLGLLARTTYGNWVYDQPVICTDKVRYEGDIVAAVVADNAASALRALDAIVVDYEPLPSVMTIDDALAADAPALFDGKHPGVHMKLGRSSRTENEPSKNVLFEYEFEDGDIDGTMADAAHVFEDRFDFSSISHFYLEPFICIAHWRADRIEVWACNQDPFVLRQDLSEIFDLPEGRFRIQARYVGGGFGGKSYCKYEPLTVLLSQMAQAPVRLLFSLDESMLTLRQHGGQLVLKTAVDDDGRLLARHSEIKLDGGAYADASAQVAARAGYRSSGPYRWQAYSARSRIVRTTTIPAGSFRGMGGTQASYASECQIDMIARRLGLDPVEFRLKNLIELGEPFKEGDSRVDSDIAEGFVRAVQELGEGQSTGPSDGCVRTGQGYAIGLKDGGSFGRLAKATVKLTTDGHPFVLCGAMEIGQGARSSICRLVADVLKVPLAWVKYAELDTDITPYDQGTHASCSTTLSGNAVLQAATVLRQKVLALASVELDCDEGALEYRDGMVVHDRQELSIGDLIKRRYGRFGFELEASGFVHFPKDANAPFGAPHLYWMPHWVGVRLEVDTETGVIRILDMVTGVDAGHAIDHAAVRGQDEGGSMVALAQSLFEHVNYQDGELASPTPLTYKVPAAADIPDRYTSFILEQGRGPGPMGAKGVGEAGMLGVAAAVANAIHDAIGIRITGLPFTPERVLAALNEEFR